MDRKRIGSLSDRSLTRRTILKSGAGAFAASLLGIQAAGGADAPAPVTWLISSPDAFRSSQPGEALLDEARELQERQSSRTQAQIESIARWGTGPAPLAWTNVALELIVRHRSSPPRAARALALLHTTMADTVTAVEDAKRAIYRPAPALDGIEAGESSFPSTHAAVAAAAAGTLAVLFPDEPVGALEALAADAAESRLLAGKAYRSDIQAGITIGGKVAKLAVARALDDGADLVWNGERPEGEGAWQPTPPDYREDPLEPMAGSWRPWLVPDVAAARPSSPPAWGSEAWRAQVSAVRDAVANRTPEQEAAVLRWAGGSGSVTPAGLWIEIARNLIVRDGLSDADAAHALAMTSVALMDGFICCWDAKYAYWYPRPVTADPDLNVLIPTPPFPSYTSGHSTISMAAATVLGHLFPADRDALLAQANEAKQSRLWAGIHYPIDNDIGVAMGDLIGRITIELAGAR